MCYKGDDASLDQKGPVSKPWLNLREREALAFLQRGLEPHNQVVLTFVACMIVEDDLKYHVFTWFMGCLVLLNCLGLARAVGLV